MFYGKFIYTNKEQLEIEMKKIQKMLKHEVISFLLHGA